MPPLDMVLLVPVAPIQRRSGDQGMEVGCKAGGHGAKLCYGLVPPQAVTWCSFPVTREVRHHSRVAGVVTSTRGDASWETLLGEIIWTRTHAGVMLLLGGV